MLTSIYLPGKWATVLKICRLAPLFLFFYHKAVFYCSCSHLMRSIPIPRYGINIKLQNQNDYSCRQWKMSTTRQYSPLDATQQIRSAADLRHTLPLRSRGPPWACTLDSYAIIWAWGGAKAAAAAYMMAMQSWVSDGSRELMRELRRCIRPSIYIYELLLLGRWASPKDLFLLQPWNYRPTTRKYILGGLSTLGARGGLPPLGRVGPECNLSMEIDYARHEHMWLQACNKQK